VLPPWWSTWWFRLAALIALCATLAALYRYRLAKVSAQYRIRLEERINERNRLARELHDTLLQTFQGLIFRMQAARHMLPGRPGEAGRMLDLVLDKSDEAIIEGRNAVQALRDPTQGDDVIGSVKRLGEELAKVASGTIDFSVKIFGRPMNFDPSIQHEIVRIVCEALRNAFKHSGASTIECVFAFSDADLRVRVHDNGVGLGDKNGAAPGAKKCWGIRGMRERAEKIGADLVIKSSAGFGTSVELSVGSQTGPSRALSGEPKQ
jgi:signal transduction histidine kinase